MSVGLLWSQLSQTLQYGDAGIYDRAITGVLAGARIMRVMFRKYALSLQSNVPFGAASSFASLNGAVGLKNSCLDFLHALTSILEVRSCFSQAVLPLIGWHAF